MTLDQRKIDLIKRIASSTDEQKIEAVDRLLSGTIARRIDLSKHKNIKQKFDLEEAKRKRPRKGIDMEAFFKDTKDLEWDQSIEELLADLD